VCVPKPKHTSRLHVEVALFEIRDVSPHELLLALDAVVLVSVQGQFLRGCELPRLRKGKRGSRTHWFLWFPKAAMRFLFYHSKRVSAIHMIRLGNMHQILHHWLRVVQKDDCAKSRRAAQHPPAHPCTPGGAAIHNTHRTPQGGPRWARGSKAARLGGWGFRAAHGSSWWSCCSLIAPGAWRHAPRGHCMLCGP
jgi:hypothetical protein